MANLFKLNDEAVNGREDWFHLQHAGRPQGKRYIVFPGLTQRVSITGPVMPGDMEVFGSIEGVGEDRIAAKTQLLANIRSETARQSAGVMSVTLDDIEYGDYDLTAFEVLGKMIAFVKSGNNNAVRVPVRYRFRKLGDV